MLPSSIGSQSRRLQVICWWLTQEYGFSTTRSTVALLTSLRKFLFCHIPTNVLHCVRELKLGGDVKNRELITRLGRGRLEHVYFNNYHRLDAREEGNIGAQSAVQKIEDMDDSPGGGIVD
jgi:hypothetical protein